MSRIGDGRFAEISNAVFSRALAAVSYTHLLVAPTRQEAGCLNYDLHILPEDPAKFLFHENWTSRAQLDAHLQSAHIKGLLPRVDALCVAFPEITIWGKIV